MIDKDPSVAGHPPGRGFVYLAAVIDWMTCRMLALRLSDTLTTDFCLEVLEEAIVRSSRPETFNVDQSCQFASETFVDLLQRYGIRLSMDGRGRWRDNVFVERLCKTVKYEEIYLHGYESVQEANQSLTRHFAFYSQRRPHLSLDGQTPDTVYFDSLSSTQAA